MVDQHIFLNSSSCFSQQSNRDHLSSCEISRVFLKIFIYLLTWLRQVLLAACGVFPCGMRSFSLVMAHRLSCPVVCGILVPLTRDPTYGPVTEVQGPKHRTSREFQNNFCKLKYLHFPVSLNIFNVVGKKAFRFKKLWHNKKYMLCCCLCSLAHSY